MNLLTAHQKLNALAPTFLTTEAASILGISAAHAATLLSRLAKQKRLFIWRADDGLIQLR